MEGKVNPVWKLAEQFVDDWFASAKFVAPDPRYIDAAKTLNTLAPAIFAETRMEMIKQVYRLIVSDVELPTPWNGRGGED